MSTQLLSSSARNGCPSARKHPSDPRLNAAMSMGEAADDPISADEEYLYEPDLANALPGLRLRLHTFLKETDRELRYRHLYLFRQALHDFVCEAERTGMVPVCRLSAQMEALIQGIIDRPGEASPAALSTLVHAFDFLSRLMGYVTAWDGKAVERLNALVVDDEAISRRAVVNALSRADLTCVSVGDATQAMPLLAENQFDLIVADINMPGISGYEFCRRLRAMPGHDKVPVFFVTGLTDLQSKVMSLRSGGNDFVTKPFLSHELAVKAVVSTFQQRLGVPPEGEPASPAP